MAENNQENENPGGIGGGGAPSVPGGFRTVYGDCQNRLDKSLIVLIRDVTSGE